MSDTILPDEIQKQRAKWDLLLTDIELRSEQLRHAKGYNPIEMEARIEAVRQMKSFPTGTYEGWRLIIQGLTAFAAVFAAGGVVGGLLVNLLMHKIP
jgi:hypothetical protein